MLWYTVRKTSKNQISRKSVQMGGDMFHEDRPRDMTKPTVPFRNFANVPKNRQNWFSSNLILTGFTKSVRDISLLGVISDIRPDADEICALLGYYAEHSGKPVQTFRDKLSGPSSRAKKSKAPYPWRWNR